MKFNRYDKCFFILYEPVWAFNSYVNNNPKIKEWKLKVIVIDLLWWTLNFSIFNLKILCIQVYQLLLLQ